MKRGLKVVASLFALCIVTASVIVVAPPALAASKSTSSALATWYQQSGRPAFEKFRADAQRFRAVNASTTARVARQDCNHFKLDVLAASHGKLPPEPTLAFDYRYYLLAAKKSFTECMTGIESTNDVQVAEGTQGGALAVQAAVKIIRGAESGKVVAVPPSTTNLRPSIPASLLVPQCSADFKILEVAIEAYDVHNHAYPVPPAPWGAATYSNNFGPLLGSKTGGPWMSQPLETTHYVIEYDSSGNVWVEPPGRYDTSYDPAQGSFTACTAVAR
jgi:hypothetical protein